MWDVYLQDEKWLTMREMNRFWQRLRGYMAKNLDSLQEEALWFPDCSTIHTCFMKFNLDLYYLDGDHSILAVHENVGSGRFISKSGCDSVLELPTNSKPLLKVGDQLKFVSCP